MNTEKGCRVGIIGAGRVGVDWHLPDIREAGGEVTALADAVPGRAKRLADEKNVAHSFDNWRELIDCDDVDIVSICTPPHVHEKIAIETLGSGKHVYLEKPPAMNATQMENICRAAEDAGVVFLVGSNSVYFNESRLLKEKIACGELGDVYYIEMLKIYRKVFKQGWHRRKAIAGGGVGMDSCPHRLDLVMYLLDCPAVESVTARMYDYFAGRRRPESLAPGYQLMDVEEGVADDSEAADVEDTVVALIHFKNGCSFVLREMQGAHMPDQMSCRIFGSRAGVRLKQYSSDADRFMLYRDDEAGVSEDLCIDVEPNPQGHHIQAWRHFFECVREGRQTSSAGRRAVSVMRIVDAIYESAANGGRQVFLD